MQDRTPERQPLLQRAGERLAIVLARDGSESGVVTLEDILKVMFGEVKL